jgi:hypothetical protein
VLNKNAFSGTLEISGSLNKQLQVINLRENRISALNLTASYNNTLV